MKATFFALLALVAAPALAVEIVDGKPFYAGVPTGEINAPTTPYTGSVAGRALAAPLNNRAADAEFFCQLPTAAVSGAPANAANIDGNTPALPPNGHPETELTMSLGVCITANECFLNSGARAFTGVCPGNTDCCIKNDCAGESFSVPLTMSQD